MSAKARLDARQASALLSSPALGVWPKKGGGLHLLKDEILELGQERDDLLLLGIPDPENLSF